MNSTAESPAQIVCLVDDDLAVLKSIGRLLTSDGYSIHAFNNPKDFLAYVEAYPVPLVILDIWMEEMSGLEVHAQLSSLSPITRVIIITGRNDETVKQTALNLGVAAFFTKPFDGDKFLSAVRSALAMKPH